MACDFNAFRRPLSLAQDNTWAPVISPIRKVLTRGHGVLCMALISTTSGTPPSYTYPPSTRENSQVPAPTSIAYPAANRLSLALPKTSNMRPRLTPTTSTLYPPVILALALLLLCYPALLPLKAYWVVLSRAFPITTSAHASSVPASTTALLTGVLARAWQAAKNWKNMLRPLGLIIVVLVRLFRNDERGVAGRLEL